MKNAPAVTARRATKKIVRAPALLVLAAIVETTAPETQAAIVVAEQVVPVATMRLMGLVVTGRHRIGLVVTGRHRIGLVVTAIDHTRRVPLATATLDHAVMDRQLIDPVVTAIGHTRHVPLATAQPARRGLLVTAPIRRALRVTVTRARPAQVVETGLILRAPLVMGIRGRPVPVETVLTLRVLPATAKLGHAVRATTALAFRVVTEIHVHLGPAAETVPTVRAPRAMAILLVGRRALVETAPIRRAPPETARARTDLEAIVRIVRARIVHMVTSRAVSGNPMGESVARSARR